MSWRLIVLVVYLVGIAVINIACWKVRHEAVVFSAILWPVYAVVIGVLVSMEHVEKCYYAIKDRRRA